MRIFAMSDLHVDHDDNARWVRGLSRSEYRDDVLIVAGDLTHRPELLAWCLDELAARAARVLFVPGNHDLWLLGDDRAADSFEKFAALEALVARSGASMQPFVRNGTHIIPLLGWYDFSFGPPGDTLARTWMDFRACRWPAGYGADEVSAHFDRMNAHLRAPAGARVITFSHFMPRIDLIPLYVPPKFRTLDPVLGSVRLERQLRRLGSSLHVFGHSHINRSVRIDGVHYVNNALGYPGEGRITARRMLCVGEV